MDDVAALRLQWEWGADEALLDTAQSRLARATARPAADGAQPQPVAPSPAAGVQPPAAGGATGEDAPVQPAPLAAGPAEAARLAAGCDTLDALRAAMADFTGCALRDTATQLVFADGAEDVRAMLIGEAPGADEDRAGRPFVGVSGQLLDRMLASIGLDRTRVRIANVVPWRPPGNRAPTDGEIATCLPFIHRQIALIRPEFLLLLGGTAMKAMMDAKLAAAGIRRNRGAWRHLAIPGLPAPVPTLATYHPAYLLRTPSAKRESWLDLLALRHALEFGISDENVS